MNDQQLQGRLTALADDLAPDTDPYALATEARTLHRHRRRTRLAVGGLAAVTAAVVVGVPVTLGAVSAPAPSDGAAPAVSPAPVAPAGPDAGPEDERRVDEHADALEDRERELAPLRALGEQLVGALRGEGLLTGPDPAWELPCPPAADVLGDLAGIPVVPSGGSTTAGAGCGWSSGGSDPRTRLDLSLRNDAALTREVLERQVNRLAAVDGCYPTGLPGSPGFSALALCPGEEQLTWHVTLMDGGGTGAWVLTAAVGTDLSGETGVDAVIGLRTVLQSRP